MKPDKPPYPGLRSFRRDEADRFFGRDDCVDAMVDRLAQNKFLAVVGSSGSGKSSLVKTGLLRGLEMGLIAQAGSRWREVIFEPGGAPLRNLAKCLLTSDAAEPDAGASQAEIELLRAFLAHGPRSLIEWCRSGRVAADTNLLLLVDQFEELFRYQDYAGREEAEAFVALLIESAQNAQFPIYVVLTMRSEYFGACALIEGLVEQVNAGMFLTPRMTRDQCREAIVGPARVCGIDIEDILVNRLLNDLASFAPWNNRSTDDQLERLARRADQLPLLQYTLNRMWLNARERTGTGRIKLTLDDYKAINGLSGALNQHANEMVDNLTRTFGQGYRNVVEAVFRALTTGPTVTEAVRRQTQFGELVDICGGDRLAVQRVVNTFRAPGCNFLRPETDPLTDETFIDISHESLIRQWTALSEWLEREARAARLYRRLIERHDRAREPLRGKDLAELLEWRKEDHPNAAWAARYDDKLKPQRGRVDAA